MSKDFTAKAVGNVSRDPELKFSGSGNAWVNFSIAVNEQKKDGDRWVDDGVTFIDCKAFGQFAENIAESITKGTRVVVEGSIKQENWETDGQKRSKLVLLIDNIGPDLRFATAVVHKPERSSGSRSSGPAENPFG